MARSQGLMRHTICLAVAGLLLFGAAASEGRSFVSVVAQHQAHLAPSSLELGTNPMSLASNHDSQRFSRRRILQDDVEAFFDAAADGDTAEVQRLIPIVGVDAVDEFNDTALIVAAANDQTAVLRVLLDAGADINKRGRSEATALYASVQNDQIDSLKLLIEAGADVDIKSDGATPLLLASNLGQLAAVHFLLDAGADVNVEYDKNQATPLVAAADAGHVEVAKVLLAAQANVGTRTSFGYTALHRAALNNSIALVQVLLDAGADIQAIVWGNGDTVLIAAAEFGDFDLIKLLVDRGANVTAANVFGRTALHTAALLPNNTAVLALLIEQGIDVNSVTKGGVTPLDDALWNGNAVNIEYLLSQGATASDAGKAAVCGCIFTEPETNIWTPCPPDSCEDSDDKDDIKELLGILKEPETLLEAVKDADEDATEEFIANGADVNVADEDGSTALILAAVRGNTDIIEALIEAGADVNAKNNFDGSPLAYAAYFGRIDAIEAFVEAGVDVNAADTQGFAPLHIAAEQGQINAVAALLEAGADANLLTDPLKISPAFSAASAQPPTIFHSEVLNVLISNGSDPTVVTLNGISPLHAAAANLGGKALMNVLIEAGVDVNIETPTGGTPLQIAAYYGYDVGVEFLLSKGADVSKGSTEFEKVCGCVDESQDENLRGCPLGTCQTQEQIDKIVTLLNVGDVVKPATNASEPSVIRTAFPCKSTTTFISQLALRIECEAQGDLE